MHYIVLEFTDTHVLLLDDGRTLKIVRPSRYEGDCRLTITGEIDLTLRPAKVVP